MRGVILVIFTITMVTATVPTLHAQSLPFEATANYLLSTCKLAILAADPATRPTDFDYQKAVDSNYCLGYIQGFKEANALTPIPNFCVPDAVTLGQLIKVVVKYMDEHPEELHLLSGLVVREALQKAFPCRK